MERKENTTNRLTKSEACSWGGDRHEGGDWLIRGCTEDSREEEVLQIVRSVVGDNQSVREDAGTKRVFQLGKRGLPSGREEVLAEESLDGA